LVEQDSNDEPADRLLTRISQTRQQLIDAGTQRASKETPALSAAEAPFELPPTWVWTPLGNVQNFVNGFTFKSQEYQTEGVGIVRIGDIQRGEISTDGMKLVATRYLTELDERLHVRPGDLLIAMSGATTGKLGFNGTNSTFLLNQRVGKLDFLEVNSNYAHLFLQTQVQENLRISSGSAIPNLSTTQINSMPFPLPPLAEQHRIVAKVDELMGLCDRLEAVQGQRRGVRVRLNRSSLDRLTSVSGVDRAGRSGLSAAWQRVCDHFEVLYDTPETLPDLRQTILQLAVQGKLVPQDPNDEPAEELLEKLKARREELIANGDLKKSKTVPLTDDDIDITVSDHWQWSRLNDLVEVMNSGWSPACEPNPTNDESEWGVLKTTSVQSFVFWEHAHKRLPDNLEPRPEAEAKPGDLLMTRAGPQNRVGISCLVRAVRPRLMISDKIIRFHLIEPFMYDEFVALCLNAGVSQEHIEKSKSGMAASQMNISQTKFRMTPIPVPPHAEQKRIVSKVTHVLSQLTRLESTLTRREATRTQLLTAAIH